MAQIIWVSVAEILTEWTSCDRGVLGDTPFYIDYETEIHEEAIRYGEVPLGVIGWDTLLEYKRKDVQYRAVFETIALCGFLSPLTYMLCKDLLEFGDGHHRFAAALELGYKYIPFVLSEGLGDAIRDDSGSSDVGDWDFDSLGTWTLLHPENPKPETPQMAAIIKAG